MKIRIGTVVAKAPLESIATLAENVTVEGGERPDGTVSATFIYEPERTSQEGHPMTDKLEELAKWLYERSHDMGDWNPRLSAAAAACRELQRRRFHDSVSRDAKTLASINSPEATATDAALREAFP